MQEEPEEIETEVTFSSLIFVGASYFSCSCCHLISVGDYWKRTTTNYLIIFILQ